MAKPSREIISRRHQSIKGALEYMEARAPEDIETEVDVVVNADGSVDGQLRLTGLDSYDHDDLRKLMIRLQKAALGRRPTNAWISVGFRFPGDDRIKPENYARWRGKFQAQLYYQRASETKIPYHFQRARKVLKNLRKHGRRKANEIFIRLHWNPEVRQPKVPGSKRGKGRYPSKKRSKS